MVNVQFVIKKSMAVSDITILAEGFSDFSQKLGKKDLRYQKRRQKTH